MLGGLSCWRGAGLARPDPRESSQHVAASARWLVSCPLRPLSFAAKEADRRVTGRQGSWRNPDAAAPAETLGIGTRTRMPGSACRPCVGRPAVAPP